jgi:hypothetical protein
LGQSAPIAISVEFLEPASREEITNLAPITIGVECLEPASREKITNSVLIAISVESPDAVTILSQLARQAQKIYRNGDVEKILEILEARSEN